MLVCSSWLLASCTEGGGAGWGAPEIEGVRSEGVTALARGSRASEASSFDLDVALDGGDVVLVWAPWPGALTYTVWHGSDAYFEPGEPGTTALVTGPATSFAHAVAGDGEHHYYRVVAHGDDGDADSTTVGKYAHRLYPGYDKISQPLATDMTDAAAFFEPHADHGLGVFAFDATTQSYQHWFPGGSPFSYGVGQVPIVWVTGVWDLVYEDVGRVPPAGSVQLTLSPGLNIVTVPLDHGDTTASELYAAVPGVVRIGRWNPVVQGAAWYEGGAGDFSIEAGRDVYVEVSQPSAWPPTPGDPGAPPPPPTNPLDGIGALQPVATGLLFTEGALWDADEGALWFTDLEGDQLWRLAPGEGATLVRDASERFTNGMAFDHDGRRLECQHRTQRLVRIEADGSETVLADTWQGLRLNSPNDVVVGPDGSIYFGDAAIGAFARFGDVDPADMPLGFRGLYRLDPAGTLHLLDSGFVEPTGIELSPAATTLYVSDWGTGRVHAYPVHDDGSTGAGEVINEEMPMADGMCSDAHGNLYVTTHQGLWVLRPNGTPWGLVPVPEEPSNCTFGGEGRTTLYVTAGTSVYAAPVAIAGATPFEG